MASVNGTGLTVGREDKELTDSLYQKPLAINRIPIRFAPAEGAALPRLEGLGWLIFYGDPTCLRWLGLGE